MAFMRSPVRFRSAPPFFRLSSNVSEDSCYRTAKTTQLQVTYYVIRMQIYDHARQKCYTISKIFLVGNEGRV